MRSPRSHTLEMLVLQATPFCNIDCSYCYLPNRTSTQRMTEATLKQTFECVFNSPFLSDGLTILWHAGEPLVPGVAYYERAFEILQQRIPPGLAVAHNIQTNGILLDQRWVDFFKQNGVKIGVSIDGPARLHDGHRKTRAQGGTFERTMAGLRILRESAYPFHVITVLTRDSLNSTRELFDFYVENDITEIAFNIEEIEGNHGVSSLEGHNVDMEVRQFFREFLDLVETSPVKLDVREFNGAFHGIANPAAARYGNPMVEPLRTVSIDVNGDISTFSPELLGYGTNRHGQFVFGNVHRNALADVLLHPRFLQVNGEIERGVELCRETCEYFEICLGGCPANKLFENATFDTTETLFCRLAKKAVIDVVLERVERELELAS